MWKVFFLFRKYHCSCSSGLWDVERRIFSVTCVFEFCYFEQREREFETASEPVPTGRRWCYCEFWLLSIWVWSPHESSIFTMNNNIHLPSCPSTLITWLYELSRVKEAESLLEPLEQLCSVSLLFIHYPSFIYSNCAQQIKILKLVCPCLIQLPLSQFYYKYSQWSKESVCISLFLHLHIWCVVYSHLSGLFYLKRKT